MHKGCERPEELEEKSLFPPPRLALAGRKGVYWLRLPNETP
jgi:hypothetical protein